VELAPAAEEAPAAVAEDEGKKRAREEEQAAGQAEVPEAKQAKVEAELEPAEAAAPAPAPPAAAPPGQPRERQHQDHPAAKGMRKLARKAGQVAEEEGEPEVLFPVGQSPADLPCVRRLRTATVRRPRSSRAAWGRLKQVGLVDPAGWLVPV
jgi:hypothetical protein